MPNNIGAFGENFPYSNQHDMNMDWVIKIAKDFLDQYSTLQQTIADGLEGLENKAEELENLLQAWYDTHSEDIANQLADALSDLNEWYTEHQNYLDQTLINNENAFDTHAEQKGAEVIASIPDTYTDLFNRVVKNENETEVKLTSATGLKTNLEDGATYTDNYFISQSGVITPMNGMCYSSEITLPEGEYRIAVKGTSNDNSTTRVHGYDSSGTWVKELTNFQLDGNYGFGVAFFSTVGLSKIRVSTRMNYAISITKYIDEAFVKALATTDKVSNYMDTVKFTEGIFVNEQGVAGTNSALELSERFRMPYGEYILTVIGTTNDNTITRVHGYDANGNWIKQLGWSLLTEKLGYCQIKINTYGCPYICVSSRIGYIFTLTDADNLKDILLNNLCINIPTIYEFGAISPVSGQDIASPSTNNRARISGYIDLSTDFILTDNPRYLFALYLYDRDNTYIGNWVGDHAEILEQNIPSHWIKQADVKKIYDSVKQTHPNCLIRLAVKRSDDQAFTIEYAQNIKLYKANKEILVATMSLFENWAVCGASYDSGNFNDGTADYNKDHLNLSWVQILARRTGTTAKNYTVGGWNTRNFIDSTGDKGLTQALADAPKDLYIITFGGNDASTLTIGSMTDITSHNRWQDYPNTFYGNYGQIIERLKAHAPHAKFIMTTPPSPWYTSNQLAIDNAIKEIAYYYIVPVIEWESDPYMRSNLFIKEMVNAHPTPISYSGMALAFERLFSKCVEENYSYFNEWNLA